jgi:hypothetical protein
MPEKEKIEYLKSKIAENQASYDSCKRYLKARGMSDEKCDEPLYCGYFKDMIGYWTRRLEKKTNEVD